MEYFIGLSSALASLIVCGAGGLVAYGKLITKRECMEKQLQCGNHMCKKIDELKLLVVDLYKSQKEEIKLMDEKREGAKDKNVEELRKISEFIGRTQQFMVDIKNDKKDENK